MEDKKTGGETGEVKQVDANTCTHLGHFQGFGFQVIPLDNGGFMSVSAVLCTQCSTIFYPQMVKNPPPPEEPKEESKIILPN